ncbi:hypothetical protein RUM43_011361 [Polyplax serrata]|uniref:Uncharacterized protein n=1 Tax=Polyplax serrata TaxID=468196 RepID=A0AAN8P8X6_POLSC
MYLLLICLTAAVVGSQGRDSDTIFPNFMDTLTVGFRLASSFLNSKKNDIVSTVFKSFREIHETYRGFNGGGGSEGYLPFFIRLLGVNSAKMESYAFDGFIFLAHLVQLPF